MRRIFIAIMIAGSPFMGAGQDIHFSQFDMAPVLVNPAQAGHFEGFLRGNLNYKDQWRAMNGYRTYAFSADMPLFKTKWDGASMGIGTSIYQDKAGDSQMGRFEASLALSGIIDLNKVMRLSAGLSGTFAQRSISVSGLAWDNQFDGTGYNSSMASNENFADNAFGYFDLAVGVFWTYNKKESSIGANDALSLSLGGAYHHVTEPDVMFYSSVDDRLNSKIAVTASGDIGVPSTHFSIQPLVAYFAQGPMTEVLVGSLIEYRLKTDTKYTGFARESAISAGLLMRLNDALIPVIRYKMADFVIGVSYDFTISSLSPANGGRGGIELTLGYRDIVGAMFGNKATRSMLD